MESVTVAFYDTCNVEEFALQCDDNVLYMGDNMIRFYRYVCKYKNKINLCKFYYHDILFEQCVLHFIQEIGSDLTLSADYMSNHNGMNSVEDFKFVFTNDRKLHKYVLRNLENLVSCNIDIQPLTINSDNNIIFRDRFNTYYLPEYIKRKKENPQKVLSIMKILRRHVKEKQSNIINFFKNVQKNKETN